MINNYYNKTIRDILFSSVKKYKNNIFLASPNKSVIQKKFEYTYLEVYQEVLNLKRKYTNAGYSVGDRIALILGNNPIFFLHKLALNISGISCVPINIELNSSENKYIIGHSEVCLIVYSILLEDKVKLICDNLKQNINVGHVNKNGLNLNKKKKSKNNCKVKKRLSPKKESSLIYTSGTTGNPKGCILSHEYEIEVGNSYASRKGLISLKEGEDRIYNPLPVHHVNAAVFSFYGVMLTGNCQIQDERFSSSNWWKVIIKTRATVIHYLGVITAILIKKSRNNLENMHSVRLGVGAGIDPNIHKIFEDRFGFPMVELWGMTEMVRCIFDDSKDRIIGKKCFGKVDSGLEVKIIDSNYNQVFNKAGEMLIRYNKKNPKKGFFSGYYKNDEATKLAWKGGWFHTGDIVIKNNNGFLYFVDRKKSIIRRAGENISAAEVESVLNKHPIIKNIAIIPYKDIIYEEEVFAIIVLNKKKKVSINFLKHLMLYCMRDIAVYKIPAYFLFLNSMPLTNTQKIKKHYIAEVIKQNKLENKIIDMKNYKSSLKES